MIQIQNTKNTTILNKRLFSFLNKKKHSIKIIFISLALFISLLSMSFLKASDDNQILNYSNTTYDIEAITKNSNMIYAVFNVAPVNEAHMGFRSNGMVEFINVEIGDKVKKGDVLLSITNDDIKSSLQGAKANYEYAKKNYNRYKKIRNVIDTAQLEKYKLKFLQTKATLALQYANLNKTLIIAPYDGVISNIKVKQGDIITAFREALVLSSIDDVELILEFDEKYWNIVKKEQLFIYKVDAYSGKKTNNENNFAINDKYKSYTQIGKIQKVYPYINAKTRKMKARILAKKLPSGLFGDGYIIIKQ